MAYVWLLVEVLCLFGAGFFLLKVAGKLFRRPVEIGIETIASSLVVSLLFLSLAVWSPSSLGSRGTLIAVSVGGWFFFLSSLSSGAVWPGRPWWLRAWLPLASVFFLVSLTFQSSRLGWDAAGMWGLWSKVLGASGGFDYEAHRWAWDLQNHADYPKLLPLLGAVPIWLGAGEGDSWVKVGHGAFALICGIAFVARMPSKPWEGTASALLFGSAGLLFLENWIDVYADGPLSLAVFTAMFCVITDRMDPSREGLRPMTWALLVLPPLIKNEGLYASLCILPLALLGDGGAMSRRRWRSLLLPLALLLPFLAWKLLLRIKGIHGDMADPETLSRLLQRAGRFSDWNLVVQKLWINSRFVGFASVLLLTGLFLRTKASRVAFLAFPPLAYLSFLTFVFLSTPHDLKWHLSTAASRTTMVAISLCLAALAGLLVFRPEGSKTGGAGRAPGPSRS